MPELLRMPEVAAGTTSGTLCDWLVREDQQYSANDVLATIETDKAVVDFTADTDGILLRVLVSAGTEAPVGAPIALIARPGETVQNVDAVLATLVVGSPQMTTTSASPVAVPGGPASPCEPVASNAGTGERVAAASSEGHNSRIFTSPLARHLAQEAGIATESITGTGPNGRIVRRDVELAIVAKKKGDSQELPTAPQSAGPVARPLTEIPDLDAVAALTAAGFADTPHSRIRRAIALRLTESKQTIPHFYLRGSAQVDELLRLRTQLNEMSAVKISVNDLVIKAAACAHVAVPAMNVVWTADYVRHTSTVDIGTAVATTTGLVTPVLRAVERMPISVLAAATRDFAERARGGRLHQHELEGGSSTVTNLGMYGTEEFAAIINPPQSSILAVGAVRLEPVVTSKGKVRPRSVIRVTVSVDHRSIDGATAAHWMHAFLEALEQPIRLLV